MKSKTIKIIIIFVASILFAISYYFFSPYRYSLPYYNIKIGQIAEKDIIAPFSYTVYKDATRLAKEKQAISSTIGDVYKISETPNFNMIKNLNYIFEQLDDLFDRGIEEDSIKSLMKGKGFHFSDEAIQYFVNVSNRQNTLEFFLSQIGRILNIGIYSDNFQEESIMLERDGEIKEYSLRRLYSESEAKQKIISRARNPKQAQVLQELVDIIIVKNIYEDDKATEKLRREAQLKISNIIGQVIQNEKIVSKNQKVTEQEYLKIQSLLKSQTEFGVGKEKSEILLSALGIFFLNFTLLLSILLILETSFVGQIETVSSWSVIVLSATFSIVTSILASNVLLLPITIIPIAFAPLLIATVFSPQIGLIYSFFNMVFIAEFSGWNFVSPLAMTISVVSTILFMKKLNNKHSFLGVFLKLSIISLIISLCFYLVNVDGINKFLSDALNITISNIISVFLVATISPFIEKKLQLATRQVLLDFLDLNNPLMKELSEKAPGTYSHSLIVGNMAETAADAINANALLARVGSYYHDIGKIEEPDLFTENNVSSSKIHDKLLPEESAIRIKEHVARGIALARRHKLPSSVIDIVKQHHGSGIIRFFYNKAQQMGRKIDERIYSYMGPKPLTKEAVIVMIADIVESTTKSKKDHTEESLKEIIDSTVLRLIQDNQFDDAPITMKELNTIKNYMLPILKGVYNPRIDYPDTDQ